MFGLTKAVSKCRNGFFILNDADNNNYHYKTIGFYSIQKNFFS